MHNSSISVLFFEILREKGLSPSNAEHFLKLELLHINLNDRMEIRHYVDDCQLSAEEATHKLMAIKRRRLYFDLVSGKYDRRLSFY